MPSGAPAAPQAVPHPASGCGAAGQIAFHPRPATVGAVVAMDPAELDAFLAAAFPGAALPFSVARATDEGVEIVQPYGAGQLRPGGTISGPVLMTLADTTAYLAVVSRIGPEFLTVTSHLAIDFLRKPPAAGLRATGEVLKLGRRQAVVVVRIHSEIDDELVAYATVTYALPTTSTLGGGGVSAASEG